MDDQSAVASHSTLPLFGNPQVCRMLPPSRMGAILCQCARRSSRGSTKRVRAVVQVTASTPEPGNVTALFRIGRVGLKRFPERDFTNRQFVRFGEVKD